MLSTAPWDAPYWFRRQHFAAHLASSGWTVLYVEPIQTVTASFREHGLRPGRLRSGLTQPRDHAGLHVFRPPAMLPFHVKSPWVATMNRLLLRRRLRRLAPRILGSGSCVQVAYHPCDIYLVRTDWPLLYEIVDKFSAYPEYRAQRPWIERCHSRMLKASSLVVATTAELADQQTAARKLVIPNGVDLDAYAAVRHHPEPPDLARLPHPRAVYVGALYDWFDFGLLAEQARRFPELSFVLLGFHSRPLPALPANVHYLGLKPRGEVPAYLRHCDVGVIPFARNDLTRYVDPLKFYEYLAADLPTVSTFMFTLRQYEAPGVLAVAEDSGSFARGLGAMLKDRERGALRRREIAEQHAWPRLARRFEEALMGLEREPAAAPREQAGTES